MCGRFEFMVKKKELLEYYDIETVESELGAFEDEEVFPTNLCQVILPNQRLSVFKWGFDEPWAKRALINTRLETADEKKTSAEAFRTRRCIVPISAFFEWDANKQKKLIRVPDQAITSLAGIYNLYRNEAGDTYAGFTILTKDANEAMQGIHDRMPVILPEGFIARYLDHSSNINALKKSLLQFDTPLVLEDVTA